MAYKGVLFKIAALALFSIMAALIKATAPQVPSWQAVFFRSFFAMLIILAWMGWRMQLHADLKMHNPLGHFWRGLIGTLAMTLGFASLGLLPLPEVTAIGFTAPLLTVIFAAMFLGENVRLFRFCAVGVGLLGMVIIIHPRLTMFQSSPSGPNTIAALGVSLALGSAVFRALSQIHVRKLVQTDSTFAIAFYFSLTATLMSLLTLPLGWVMPTTRETALLIGAGLLGGVGQIMLTMGYRHAEASLLAPFDYLALLFALAIGYAVFAESPSWQTLLGGVLVIGAGLAIIWRESQLGLDRKKERARSMPPHG
ncbi:MAG: DMT family transporter [Rhodobacteraceae bacterium]|nr:DMT family transporter [Paracoccaceae bacterium]